MIFELSKVERAMILPPNVRTDAETAQAARSGFVVADEDRKLIQLQKAVTARADALYAAGMFEESKHYMSLAMRVRDMRTTLAKGGEIIGSKRTG